MAQQTDCKSSMSTEVYSLDKHIPLRRQEDGFYQGALDEAGLQEQPLDSVAEKKLLRKIDLHLIPILWVLFLCAFIDRINIGNARIQGLEMDLRLGESDYNM